MLESIGARRFSSEECASAPLDRHPKKGDLGSKLYVSKGVKPNGAT